MILPSMILSFRIGPLRRRARLAESWRAESSVCHAGFGVCTVRAEAKLGASSLSFESWKLKRRFGGGGSNSAESQADASSAGLAGKLAENRMGTLAQRASCAGASWFRWLGLRSSKLQAPKKLQGPHPKGLPAPRGTPGIAEAVVSGRSRSSWSWSLERLWIWSLGFGACFRTPANHWKQLSTPALPSLRRFAPARGPGAAARGPCRGLPSSDKDSVRRSCRCSRGGRDARARRA